jgi:hypothetical protein
MEEPIYFFKIAFNPAGVNKDKRRVVMANFILGDLNKCLFKPLL